MSIATWKAEYYGTDQLSNPVAHSLLKWTGLRPEALEFHDLRLERNVLKDSYGEDFRIDSSTCALCTLFISTRCEQCPLRKVLGNRCDNYMAPYDTFLDTGDPEPMIKALELCV